MHCLLHSARLCGLTQGLRKQDKSRLRRESGLETVRFLNKDHQQSLCLASLLFLPSGDMKAFKILSCLFSQNHDKKTIVYKATSYKMETQIISV